MDNTQQEKVEVFATDVVTQAKKEKDKCQMCKFALTFSFVALLLVLVLIFVMKIPAAGSVPF